METVAPLWLWATFVAIVLVSLFVDFVVLKKQGAQDIGVKEALNWSLIWIALSFLFNGLFWWAIKDTTGSVELANTKSLEFLTGYLIEKSLAVDNIFVFLMIFTYFAVPEARFDDRHHWCHRVAHSDDSGGGLVTGRVPLDLVRVWCFPDPHGGEDVVGCRQGTRFGRQPCAQAVAQAAACQSELRW
jgi:hypothetical protein